MRLVLPRGRVLLQLTFLAGVVAWGGWRAYDMVSQAGPIVWRDRGLLLELMVLTSLFVVLLGGLLVDLRGHPLTWWAGSWRLGRRRIRAGEELLIGPITDVGGRRLCFTFRIFLGDWRSFRVRLRMLKRPARIAFVTDSDAHPVHEQTITVNERDWDTDTDRNGNEIAIDLPTKMRTCYIVVQAGVAEMGMKISGRVTICLRLSGYAHVPDTKPFRQCRGHVRPSDCGVDLPE